MNTLRRRLGQWLPRLFADRRGSSDLNTYLLLTAAGCTMVGLTAPSLFNSSKTASNTFEKQVQILERGASSGGGSSALGGASSGGFDLGGLGKLASSLGGSGSGSSLTSGGGSMVSTSGGTISGGGSTAAGSGGAANAAPAGTTAPAGTAARK